MSRSYLSCLKNIPSYSTWRSSVNYHSYYYIIAKIKDRTLIYISSYIVMPFFFSSSSKKKKRGQDKIIHDSRIRILVEIYRNFYLTTICNYTRLLIFKIVPINAILFFFAITYKLCYVRSSDRCFNLSLPPRYSRRRKGLNAE